MSRILLVHTDHYPNDVSVSEVDIRRININPHLAELVLADIGIEPILDDPYWNFDKELSSLAVEFKPDFILVHPGRALYENPLLVIQALINVSKKLPNVKIGFQFGKDHAMKIFLRGGYYGFGIGIDSSEVLSSLENDLAFQETDELKEIIKKVYVS